jgi:hypothetical protein
MRESGHLFPAEKLMERSGRADLMRARRSGPIEVRISEALISIRDQAVLHRGNAQFPDGYTFEDLIESLNHRVFFWPGKAGGPNDYGMRHFKRYEEENPVILRIAVESLLVANPNVEPRFCRFNSGSPRCSFGKKSPRGPNVFLLAEEFSGGPSDVVEVTFDSEISLPRDSEFGKSPTGPWKSLFNNASVSDAIAQTRK